MEIGAFVKVQKTVSAHKNQIVVEHVRAGVVHHRSVETGPDAGEILSKNTEEWGNIGCGALKTEKRTSFFEEGPSTLLGA